jgi:hypothetical protein
VAKPVWTATSLFVSPCLMCRGVRACVCVCVCVGGGLGYRIQYCDCLQAGWPRGWSLSPSRGKNFVFSMSSRPVLRRTQPPIQWVPGALSLGVNRLEHEADHSPPTSVRVKNKWIYTATPHTLL